MECAGCKICKVTASSPLPDLPRTTNSTTFFLCMSGRCRWRMNLIPHVLTAGSAAVILRGQLIDQVEMSADYSAFMVSQDRNFISSLGIHGNLHAFFSLQDVPIIPLTETQYDAVMQFLQMMERMKGSDNPYKMEVLQHLTCAMYYGFGYYLNQLSDSHRLGLSRDQELTRMFMRELRQHFRSERQVGFYADRLCVSPGYLSKVVRRCSGKRATEWIDDFVVLEAKVLLTYTTKTIQQISAELGFTTQSFFGTFFKRHVGMGPREYRDADGRKAR